MPGLQRMELLQQLGNSHIQLCVQGICQVPGTALGLGKPMTKPDVALLSRSSQSNKKTKQEDGTAIQCTGVLA